MGLVTTTSGYDPMMKIELEAAEALAGLACVPEMNSGSNGGVSGSERVKDESNDGNSSFDILPKCSSNTYEVCCLFFLFGLSRIYIYSFVWWLNVSRMICDRIDWLCIFFLCYSYILCYA